ncbi:MAG: class I SAM-dependent methyltransferase [Geminicoccaceae bacterium]
MPTPFSPVQNQINAYFPPSTHPYRLFECSIHRLVDRHTNVLDIGCGRTAPVLRTLIGKAGRLQGIDCVDFALEQPGLELIRNSFEQMGDIDDNSVDLAYSRSVMEHVQDVDRAFSELYRVLKPGGVYLFLTPNAWDYATILSRAVPNRFHGPIVRLVEGRDLDDVFPTYYRANSISAIRALAQRQGLQVEHMEYLGQYPAYFTFNRVAFYLAGAYERTIRRVSKLHFLRGWISGVLRK